MGHMQSHLSKLVNQRNRPLALGVLMPVCALSLNLVFQAQGQEQQEQGIQQQSFDHSFVQPAVFQAAGPKPLAQDPISIQSTVDEFRAALGANNGNDPHTFPTGRREINWDGGSPNIVATAPFPPVTPFDVFLNARGGRFTTPGIGLTQATPSGLATLFNNPTYANIFSTFSPSRLFTPVGSNITEALFFVPGSNGAVRATVRGFGAVFTDVDQPDGSGHGTRRGHREEREDREASTLIEYFGTDNKLLFRSVVPASPGDGSLSFFGIVFDKPLIARVRITTGNTAPGPDDNKKHDIVMMDDFIYGEPASITMQ